MSYPKNCVFCGVEMYSVHETHNPYPFPVNEEGRCCAECNEKYVIPKRFEMLGFRNDLEEEVK
jgi:hypothetical protein